ncbi:phosphatidylinositol 3,4,5-trisphosphate 3-phosphatase TPTE2-like isoform X2 [Corticium candelabrum]|uniref:phosphatidylinositol 3,4,5-trisphosphate 3-phosphatase TPTE2-like isoform X2 n=1 Tax=Corticium candelabrum TaxID=121492 RepID=UPI002E2546E1|nr:phosphatidylinositol 3,4,5-trisphosphate 3-phosphatase TPTE2-like isoform X2 [Corticium candelabrum]
MCEATKFRKDCGSSSSRFQVLTILVLIADVVLTIVGLATGNDDKTPYVVVSVVFVAYFAVEVSLRIFGRGKEFFTKWYEVLDLAVIVISAILTVVYVIELRQHSYLKLVILARCIRFLLWFRFLFEHKLVTQASRHMVSQNKRRFQEDGFDLDLTYVTKRVIAMSFPSSGKQGLYRNPIKEVARLLDTRHFDSYKVYNLCSEKCYDTSYFHGRVLRIRIDDHTVPPLMDIVSFCDDVKEWMEANPENVIAVHCKGGKGRTGLMISAWLVCAGLFDEAKDSLKYFGSRRTDLSEGSKFQGVETPSQSRYVGYYELILQRGGLLPERVPKRIKSIQIDGTKGIGKGNGYDLTLHLLCDKLLVFELPLCPGSNTQSQYSIENNRLSVELIGTICPRFAGDVAIKVHCSSKVKLKKLYGDCLFFFHFHTGFIEDNRLHLKRCHLDNPHKSKTHHVFRENFAVTVLFTDVY